MGVNTKEYSNQSLTAQTMGRGMGATFTGGMTQHLLEKLLHHIPTPPGPGPHHNATFLVPHTHTLTHTHMHMLSPGAR